MAHNGEVFVPGGVYFEGRDGSNDVDIDDRTDISVEFVNGDDSVDRPDTFVIHVTTGNATFAVTGVTPADLVRIGRFFVEQGESV